MTILTYILAVGHIPFLPYGISLRAQVQAAVNHGLTLDTLSLQPSVRWETV